MSVVCVCVVSWQSRWGEHAEEFTWRSEDTFVQSVLSF